MSKESERFGQMAMEFIAEHGHEYLSEELALEDFVQRYNQAIQNGDLDFFDSLPNKINRLLEEAYDLHDSDKRRSKKLFRDVLRLDASNIEAKLGLLSFEEILDYSKGLQELEAEEKLKWQQGERIGWANLEERPYFRLKYQLANFFLQQSMNRLAAHHFEELFTMEEGDHQGARYELMMLYCQLEDYEKAKKLFEMEERYHHEDDLMIFPMLLLSLETGHAQEADFYFQLLLSQNPVFERLLDLMQHDDVQTVMQEAGDLTAGYYQPNSMQSLVLAMSQFPDFSESDYFISWMKQAYGKYKPKDKKIENPSISDRDLLRLLDGVSQLSVSSEAVKRISGSPLYALRQHKLIDYADFKKKTEAQVLAIPGVGRKTIAQLKKNGVVFRQPRKKKTKK